MISDSARELIDWVAGLPAGADVAFCERSFGDPADPAAHSFNWCDVHLPAGPDVLITVSSPGHCDRPDCPLDSLEVAYDALLTVRFVDGQVLGVTLTLPDGFQVPVCDEELFSSMAADWNWFWRTQLTADPDEPGVWHKPAWTPAAVAAALAGWAHQWAGRDDLTFTLVPAAVYDGDEDDLTDEEIEALADGIEFIDLGDGVIATGEVFDTLLGEGPDTAARLTSAIKQALTPRTDFRPGD